MKSYKSPVSTSAVAYKASAKGSGFSGFARGFATVFKGDDLVAKDRLTQKLNGVKQF